MHDGALGRLVAKESSEDFKVSQGDGILRCPCRHQGPRGDCAKIIAGRKSDPESARAAVCGVDFSSPRHT